MSDWSDPLDLVVTFSGNPSSPITLHIELDDCPRADGKCLTGGAVDWTLEPVGNQFIRERFMTCGLVVVGYSWHVLMWLEDPVGNVTEKVAHEATCIE